MKQMRFGTPDAEKLRGCCESPLEQKLLEACFLLKQRAAKGGEQILIYPQYSITETKRYDNRDSKWCVNIEIGPAIIDSETFDCAGCHTCFGFEEFACKFVRSYTYEMARLDFALLTRKGNFDIECDGKEFHASVDAKLHDENRDEKLMVTGWGILRLRGDIIHKTSALALSKIVENFVNNGTAMKEIL